MVDQTAILSDVNGNAEALAAVFADIRAQGIQRIVFLGDSIGYCSDSLECYDAIRKTADIYLLGRLELRLLKVSKPNDVLPDPVLASCSSATHSQLAWLKGRNKTASEGRVTFAHSSPLGVENGCLEMDDFMGLTRLRVLDTFDGLLCVGDNHKPWIYSTTLGVATARDLKNSFRIPDTGQTILSVGSVGFPKDRDPRACYAIVQDDLILWRRVEYDIDKTISKLIQSEFFARDLPRRLEQGV